MLNHMPVDLKEGTSPLRLVFAVLLDYVQDLQGSIIWTQLKDISAGQN